MALSNRINMRGGGGDIQGQLIGVLDTLTRTYPSNTSSSPVARKFNKDSYVVGMTVSNGYNPSTPSNISFNGNTLTFNTLAGVGLGLVLSDNLKPNATYEIDYTINTLNVMAVTYYKTDGTFGGTLTVTNNRFTVPNDAEYVLLIPYNGQAQSTQCVFTLNSLKKVA